MKRSVPSAAAAAVAAVITTLALSVLPTSAQAAGSVEAGQAKAIVCAACHGVDGNSLNPEWPSIAGQNEAYLVRILQAFRKGERSNVLMSAQATALTDQEIADLAAFFASRPLQGKTADPKLATAGERLFRGGNKETGVAACIACHGPAGAGNGPAGYPVVGSQHAAYTAAQLKAYRAGERTSDLNQMMRNTAARLTDAEIEAVSSYLQGLR